MLSGSPSSIFVGVLYRQSGNALFLILIAVALFAALSYAVTQSGRGGGSIDKETAILDAAQITQYSALVHNAVTRIMILNGCSETELSFENTITAQDYTNATSPSDKSCHVFDRNGGGMTYQSPSSEWLGPLPSDLGHDAGLDALHGVWFITDASFSGIGVSGGDLALILPYVTKEICVAMNDMFSIVNPSGNPPQDNAIAYDIAPFDGNYGSNKVFNNTTSGNDEFNGKASGCIAGGLGAGFAGQPTGTYAYYQVLIER